MSAVLEFINQNRELLAALLTLAALVYQKLSAHYSESGGVMKAFKWVLELLLPVTSKGCSTKAGPLKFPLQDVPPNGVKPGPNINLMAPVIVLVTLGAACGGTWQDKAGKGLQGLQVALELTYAVTRPAYQEKCQEVAPKCPPKPAPCPVLEACWAERAAVNAWIKLGHELIATGAKLIPRIGAVVDAQKAVK